ncbi:MAG TPA: hypothetical protein VFU97_24480 [Xanthobacteraceae bacterium]|nr:hypothetical protein [Xanthobacteraceae bacterium]
MIRTRANNQRATNDEIRLALNEHICDLWDTLLQVHGDQYGKALDPLTITTSPTVSQYTLDDAFLKALGVWWERATNDHVEILPYEQNRARGPSRFYGWNRYQGSIFYRIEGTVIRFQPTPQDVHTVLIDYIPPAFQFDEATADTDTFDGYNGFELYPIYMTAAELARDESDFELVDRLEAKAAAVKARIEKVSDRDQANAPRIAQRRSREWHAGWRDIEEDIDIR